MSQQFSEGGLTFHFPNGWLVCRPGGTFLYSARFQHFCGGCKEADFVACDRQMGKLWLIEVKDYAQHARTKPVPIQDEMAHKVRDTLALLTAAAATDATPSQAGKLEAGEFARAARSATSIGVVLHCEPQPRGSVLFPAVTMMANLLQELRTAFRALDAEIKLARKGAYSGLPWKVT